MDFIKRLDSAERFHVELASVAFHSRDNPVLLYRRFCRGATNEANVKKFGLYADVEFAFHTRPASIVVGTFIADAIFAAAMTGLAGFFF